MRLHTFISALFLLTALSLSVSVQARETIHKYLVDIKISETGKLDIHEKIEVTAEGVDIKRGIYRDLPNVRRTFLGGALPIKYNIKEIRRDGAKEPFHTKRSGNNLRIYIGKKSKLLERYKKYTYDIYYSVENQVFFFEDYDELYWNAIGTGWKFPIEQAYVNVTFPESATIGNHNVYTGKALSRGADFLSEKSGNLLHIKTTRQLNPYEGVTFAAAIPKGHIDEKSGLRGMGFFWAQHPGLQTALIGLFASMLFAYFIWDRVGRDPKSRGRTPFYKAPKNISPAMAAFIYHMGNVDHKKNLSTVIISLASKGYFTIEEKKSGWLHKEYVIHRTPAEGLRYKNPLTEDEELVYDAIKSGTRISSSSEKLVGLAGKLHRHLDKTCRKTYFYLNFGWWCLSLIPMAGTILVLSLNEDVISRQNIFLFFLACVLLFIFINIVVSGIRSLFFSKSIKSFLGYLFIGAIFTPSLALPLSEAMGSEVVTMSWLTAGTILLLFIFTTFMRYLLEAPTLKGRRIMDHLSGLQLYMSAVEEKILKKFDPPEMSRELYEEYLPYAVALDIESKWGDKFTQAMAVAATGAAVGTVAYHTSPSWYHGSSSNSYGDGFSVSSMVNNFSSTVSAAATSNNSSSGSSGGGSSGGGGGGGGGGGW